MIRKRVAVSEYVLYFLADMSGSQWNKVTLNEEDLSYMLDDETTPVKACGDLAYATHYGRDFFLSVLYFHSYCLLRTPKLLDNV